MTTQRRASRPRRGAPRRTGRNVWVNDNLSVTLSDNSLIAVPLLTDAVDFMTFDTTIVAVIINEMTMSGQKLTSGRVTARAALMIAPDTMDSDDFQALITNSIGPPWMWVGSITERVADQAIFNFEFANSRFPVRVKAKRRFRENDSTLFLVFQNALENGSIISENLQGMVRTLIHIP